jgi:hypothetical protein
MSFPRKRESKLIHHIINLFHCSLEEFAMDFCLCGNDMLFVGSIEGVNVF